MSRGSARRGSLPRGSVAKAGAHFLPADSYRHGYKPSELYKCRDTILIGAANLSPVKKLVVDTGGASQYKLSRSQNPDSYRDVVVQDL